MIPKSGSGKRIMENLSIFDFSLSEEQMSSIEKLGVEVRRTCPDPSTIL